MLKTISAALLAVSVLAAPALAATSGKTAQTTTQAHATKSTQLKTAANTDGKASVKPNALNANAKMSHHRAHHKYHKVHRHHPKKIDKKIGALKTPSKTHTKVSSSRHGASTIKRG